MNLFSNFSMLHFLQAFFFFLLGSDEDAEKEHERVDVTKSLQDTMITRLSESQQFALSHTHTHTQQGQLLIAPKLRSSHDVIRCNLALLKKVQIKIHTLSVSTVPGTFLPAFRGFSTKPIYHSSSYKVSPSLVLVFSVLG